jgi:hypothetical protein
MEDDDTRVSLAKTQAKRVRREATVLVQMLARIEENLQPQEAQGNVRDEDQ